jgi:hypothetical protein
MSETAFLLISKTAFLQMPHFCGLRRPIHARLPFVHYRTADAAVQEDLRRADERQERAARNLVQSPTFGAPGVGGRVIG